MKLTKNLKIGINQPHYLSWRLYYERIKEVNVHVVLDHVQFEKNSLVNRNKICRVGDDPFYLSVPLSTKGKFGNLAINKISTSELINWRRKHIDSIKSTLLKNSHDPEFIFQIIEIIARERTQPDFLKIVVDLDRLILKKLNINTKIIFSSELAIKNSKSEMILEICKSLGANTYLSGPGGKNYLNKNKFIENNIDIEFTDKIFRQNVNKYRSISERLSILVDI